MKIKSDRLITEKEGYEAMLYLLMDYWKLTGSRDLTEILSGGEYVEKDIPADSAFWYYWLDAIEKVRKEGSPPLKVLYKNGQKYDWAEAMSMQKDTD